MENFKEWINRIYPEYFCEQSSSPSFKNVDARDIKLLNSAGLSFNPNDILRQIVNVKPYDLMSATRHDPAKFQSDVAKMQSPGSQENEMIMLKQNMSKPHRVLVVTDQSVQKVTGESDVDGFIANLPNNERILVVPQSGYDRLPDNNNILGVMNQKGKSSMAHEAGHLAQNKPNKFANQNMSQMDYIGLPDEVGTRLGFLKNINSKETLKRLGSKGFDQNTIQYINSMINALPDDEAQRFETIIDLTKLFEVTVRNNKEITSILNTRELFSNFVKNVFQKFISNVFYSDYNIKQLVEYIASIKKNDPTKYQNLIKNLKYAYPRVALGGPEETKSQERQMA